MNYEDYIFRSKGGKEYPNEEKMLAELLLRGVIFVNSFNFIYPNESEIQEETLVCFVNCNDVFAWGSAETEGITIEELPILFKMYCKDPEWGSIKWVCKKRGERPQRPIREEMKEKKAWEDWMDDLEPNYYDERDR